MFSLRLYSVNSLLFSAFGRAYAVRCDHFIRVRVYYVFFGHVNQRCQTFRRSSTDD